MGIDSKIAEFKLIMARKGIYGGALYEAIIQYMDRLKDAE